MSTKFRNYSSTHWNLKRESDEITMFQKKNLNTPLQNFRNINLNQLAITFKKYIITENMII
jgi:hypothetical protein